MRKQKVILIIMGVLLLGWQGSCLAFQEEILTSKNEIWTAAKTVLASHGGIAKENADKGILESKWVEDVVKKKRSILPERIAGGGPTVSQTVRRRYRLRVVVEEKAQGSAVSIQGTFEERPYNDRPQTPWNKITPGTEDYQVERDTFFKILEIMQQARIHA